MRRGRVPAHVRVDQPHRPRAVFVHGRSLRGVRRVRARTPRDASIAHDSSFLSRRERRAARVQINRLIRRRSVLVRDGNSRHRPTNTARGGVTRRRGTEENSKGDAVSPRRVRVVRPGRVKVRPGRVDGSRDSIARAISISIFARSSRRRRRRAPRRSTPRSRRRTPWETSPSWTAIASGARFASATRTDSP